MPPSSTITVARRRRRRCRSAPRSRSTGTAVDAGGGQVVAAVEVSVDGGDDAGTWRPARRRGAASCHCRSPLGSVTIRRRPSTTAATSRSTVRAARSRSARGRRRARSGATAPCPRRRLADDSAPSRSACGSAAHATASSPGCGSTRAPATAGTHVGKPLDRRRAPCSRRRRSPTRPSSGGRRCRFAPDRRGRRARPTSRRCTWPQGHYSGDAEYFATAATTSRRSGLGGRRGRRERRLPLRRVRLPRPRRPAPPNYWVDVVFDVTNNVAPTVVGTRPAAGVQSVSRRRPVQATVQRGDDPSSLVFEVRTAGGTRVPGTTTVRRRHPHGVLHAVRASSPARTPRSPRPSCPPRTASGAPLAATVRRGASPRSGCPVPRRRASGTRRRRRRGFVIDTSAVELGVRFRADVAGAITALRFYRGPAAPGDHVGHLWDAAGTLLSTAVFPASRNRAGSRRTSRPRSPCRRNADLRRVLPRSRRSLTRRPSECLDAAVDRGPLHALRRRARQAGNGVFRYGAAGGFPSSTFEATQLLGRCRVPGAAGHRRPRCGQRRSRRRPDRGRDRRAGRRATFDGPIAPASLDLHAVRPGRRVGAPAPYLRRRHRHSDLHADERAGERHDLHRVRSGDRHVAGNAMAQPTTWSFTTAVIAGAIRRPRSGTPRRCPTPRPPTTTSAIELGVVFRPERDGAVDGRPLLQGRRQRRHARRPPVDGRRRAARLGRHLRRDGGRVAAGDVRHADPGHRRPVVRGFVPRAAGSLPVHRWNFVGAPWSAHRSAAPSGGNGRYLYGPGGFPTPLRRHELLGRRDLRRHPGAERRRAGSGAVRSGCRRAAVVTTFGEPVDRRASVQAQLRDGAGATVPVTDAHAAGRRRRHRPSALAAHDLHRIRERGDRPVGQPHGRSRHLELHHR